MRVPLLTAHDATGHVHLIIGTNTIANQRCQRSVAVGAKPVVIFGDETQIHFALQQKIATGAVEHLKCDFEDGHLESLGRPEIDNVVDAVFITSGRSCQKNVQISNLCKRKRIPINVVDASSLCTFTLPALHSDGPLQVGVTTSGMGCKLASRIRRHIYSSLPPNLGSGVARLGEMRRRIQEADQRQHDLAEHELEESDDEAPSQKSTFNQLVHNPPEPHAKRLRWLAQICEHWPLARLASITDAEVDSILESYSALDAAVPTAKRKPRIILAGSGPGSPELLTLATHRAIKTADLILADKLVPEDVLALIPRRTDVRIAEKFPGNADNAQQKLLEMGLQALKRGLTVLRLKQGDPYIYGRGAEEVLFFREHGYEAAVLPGLTSALVAPIAAGISPTHRGIADEVRICTGVGRKGKAPAPPPYSRTATFVFLMVLNRLPDFVESLTGGVGQTTGGVGQTTGGVGQIKEGAQGMKQSGLTNGVHETEGSKEESKLVSDPPWPPETPCAIVERATCRDQRVVRTTLAHVAAAFLESGSRPPGLLIVGAACGVLHSSNGHRWVTEEGYGVLAELATESESIVALAETKNEE